MIAKDTEWAPISEITAGEKKKSSLVFSTPLFFLFTRSLAILCLKQHVVLTLPSPQTPPVCETRAAICRSWAMRLFWAE
jgi:hypothetical protein